ncbi:hypothetical protein SASPL_132975 [Salvia splendens]|uniref:Transcription factor MYC2 n=1 Tax=Salvia splendens TaxID=180675 RepID=A0A8X8ZHW3_SALSN|nr:hypothetical protein SASPL_132975 [Salvia splendens]
MFDTAPFHDSSQASPRDFGSCSSMPPPPETSTAAAHGRKKRRRRPKGDQSSIVGGAIEFVKELEHILQSLEAKKFALLEHGNVTTNDENDQKPKIGSPFGQFFAYPQFSCSDSRLGNKYTSQSKAAIADIEVTLIETHANIRVLSRRRLRQLSKMVAAFQSVFLTILHLNVTTLDSLVLYSISAKVEEGCQLNSADDIAGAVHHMLRIIEEEAILGCHT